MRLGIKVAVATGNDTGCDYSPDATSTDYTSVSSNVSSDKFADVKVAFPGEAITVAGQ